MLTSRPLVLLVGLVGGVTLTLGAQQLLSERNLSSNLMSAAHAKESALKGSVSTPATQERRQLGGGKATITHLARGERAYLGRLTLKGGVNVPLHRDPTEEYLVIEQGNGELFINGVGHKVAPGSVVFMPAGAEVRFTNSDQALVALQVFAGPESADKYAKWAVLE
jgi:quercetin dioxygenase-like cupin family protein